MVHRYGGGDCVSQIGGIRQGWFGWLKMPTQADRAGDAVMFAAKEKVFSRDGVY